MLPIVGKTPVVFGMCASDPMIQIEEYINSIAEMGCSGINNYPTVSIIDGKYREALEESGLGFDLEIEAIRIAAKKNMFTVAFVYDEEQTRKMLDAGADMICVNYGFTSGGLQGAKYALSLQESAKKANKIFEICDRKKQDVFKMVYGGCIRTPMDVEYIYNNTSATGYIGGSVFERLPTEKAIAETTQAYRAIKCSKSEILMNEMLNGISKYYSYVDFIKEYISANYMNEIKFQDLADVLHVSRTHLSRLFNDKIGCTFPSYVNNYRLSKARELIEETLLPFSDIAIEVGYKDYAHFSKAFKKRYSLSPQEYKYLHKKSNE